GLLSDRNQPGISGKQVPQAGQRDIAVDLSQQPQILPLAPERRARQHNEQRGEDRKPDPARARRVLDPDHPRTLGNRPSGRTASTTRNAMWPASTCQPGSMRVLMVRPPPRM